MNAQLPITEDATAVQLPAIRRPTEVRVVNDVIPVLDTARFEHMQRIAVAMAASSLIPETLMLEKKDVFLPQSKIVANCFLVINQAVRWEMDPFAVIQAVSVIKGKLCYEGKLVHAIITAKCKVEFSHEFNNEKGDALGIKITGKWPDGRVDVVEGTVGDWKTTRDGSPWALPKNHKRMLIYRGTREWGRFYSPGTMLGIYTPDEMDDDRAPAAEPPTPPEPPAIDAPKVENHAGEVPEPPTGAVTQQTPSTSASPRGGPAPDTKPTPSPTPKMEQGMVDALGGPIPPSDGVPVPPGLRRTKVTPPPFKLDAWLKTLESECKDKTPEQLLKLRESMIEPLRERLGHEGYNRAGDVLGAAMGAAQKKCTVLPKPAFDADAWYNDLSGAVSGCASIEQIIEVQKKVQQPALELVSREHYAKGKKLVAAALMQLASED